MDPKPTFSLLAHTARRVALKYLAAGDSHSTVEELAHVIAADSATSVDSLENARIELVHNHIPRLKEHGVIDHDPRNGDVVLTESGENLKALVDSAEEITAEIADTTCSK